MNIYKFRIFYNEERQNRFVAAETEDKAVETMQKHKEEIEKDGYETFAFNPNPRVYLEDVIS